MTHNKLILGVGSLGAVAAIAFAGSAVVLADTENGQNGLAQRIAQRFNLNQAEVEAVIQEDREARQEEHLNQLVEDGKITEEQKALLQEKHKEMQANREQNMNLTQEERQAKREQNRADMKAWAEENGIDLSLLGGPRGEVGPRGAGKGMGMHRASQDS